MDFEIRLENGKTKIVDIKPYSTFNAILSSALTRNIQDGYNYVVLVEDLANQLHYDSDSLKSALDKASSLNLVGIYVNTPDTRNLSTGNDKRFIALDLSNPSRLNAKLSRIHTYIGA